MGWLDKIGSILVNMKTFIENIKKCTNPGSKGGNYSPVTIRDIKGNNINIINIRSFINFLSPETLGLKEQALKISQEPVESSALPASEDALLRPLQGKAHPGAG